MTTYDACGDMPLNEQVEMSSVILSSFLAANEIPLTWRPHIQDATLLLKRQQKEIERLRNIETRVPHTVDGVPIFIGTTVYWIEPRNPPNFPSKIFSETVEFTTEHCAFLTSRCGAESCGRNFMDFTDCYSTYKAAEAAMHRRKQHESPL